MSLFDDFVVCDGYRKRQAITETSKCIRVTINMDVIINCISLFWYLEDRSDR